MPEWTQDLDRLEKHLESLAQERQRAVDAALAAADRAVEAALAAAEKAVLKAEAAADQRFASVNEFRGALTDQAAGFPTRPEMCQRFEGIEKDIKLLTGRLDRIEGSQSGKGTSWTVLVQLVGLIGAIIAIGLAMTR